MIGGRKIPANALASESDQRAAERQRAELAEWTRLVIDTLAWRTP